MRLGRAANEQPDVDWHNAINMARAPWLMEDEEAPEPSSSNQLGQDLGHAQLGQNCRVGHHVQLGHVAQQ
jgi:hypothetical protein